MHAASPLEILKQRFAPVIAQLSGEPVGNVQTHLRPAGDPKFGDYQCNAAMALGKTLGAKPHDIAKRIVAAVQLDDIAQRVEIAGPGFINIHLRDDFLAELLEAIPAAGNASETLTHRQDACATLKNACATLPNACATHPPRFAPDDRLGIQPAIVRQTVVIDYSSPNIAKQMHVGHLRTTVIGDALARVLELMGHRVIRQNHLGDWGTAIGAVITGLWYINTRLARGETLESVRERLETATALRGKSLEERRAWLTPIAEQWTLDLAQPAEQNSRRSTLDELELGYVFIQTLASVAEGAGVRVGTGDQARDLADLPRLTTSFLQRGDAWERAEWQQARVISIDACQELYARLRVTLEPQDVFGESAYEPFLADVVRDLEQRLNEAAGGSPVVDGFRTVFRIDGGAKCLFIEKMSKDGGFEPAFKTADGGPLPMIIEKSDGAHLYSTTDLAAVRYRAGGLGGTRLIYVVGSPQKLHFQMLFAAARCAGYAPPQVALEHVTFGSVLGANKRPLKTRDGGNVKLRDLLDEAERRALEVLNARESPTGAAVDGTAPTDPSPPTSAAPTLSETEKHEIAQRVGIAAIKYFDLARERNNDYVFNWDQMLAFQGNTAPYLMYAYARIRSIYRRAAEALPGECAHSVRTMFAEAVDQSGLDVQQNPGASRRAPAATDGAIAARESPPAGAGVLSGPPAGAGVLSGRPAGAGSLSAPLQLTEPAERTLALRLARFREALDIVANDLTPHVLCTYLYDLASDFMRFYETCPVLNAPDAASRLSRMRLADLTARTLKLGLAVLGIDVLERM